MLTDLISNLILTSCELKYFVSLSLSSLIRNMKVIIFFLQYYNTYKFFSNLLDIVNCITVHK